MTASWTTEPVFALIFVGRENHEVQSRRRRDSNPRPSDQGANALPLEFKIDSCVLTSRQKFQVDIIVVRDVLLVLLSHSVFVGWLRALCPGT